MRFSFFCQHPFFAGQIPYYLDEGNNWNFNTSELKRALDEARPHCTPRGLVLVNPGNPTGIKCRQSLRIPGVDTGLQRSGFEIRTNEGGPLLKTEVLVNGIPATEAQVSVV